jgi:F-type H+-transporting ATPase subunit a
MAFTPPTLASETIAHIGSFPIRNSMLMGWIAMAVLIIAALIFSRKSSRLIPKGFQNFVEVLIEGLFNFFDSVTQDKKQTRKFFPVVATIFLFVIVSNWMGILPGVGPIGIWEEEPAIEESVSVENVENAEIKEVIKPHSGVVAEEVASEEPKLIFVPFFRSAYADVNMTLALAIISIIVTQIFGIASLGFFHYAGKFFVNPFKDPIGCFVGFLELISEFAKLISFTFRLFGNIFAGEVLLVVMGFLAPFIAPIPFYGLEIFVGFVQALVFSILTLVFFKMAATSHSAEHAEAH